MTTTHRARMVAWLHRLMLYAVAIARRLCP